MRRWMGAGCFVRRGTGRVGIAPDWWEAGISAICVNERRRRSQFESPGVVRQGAGGAAER